MSSAAVALFRKLSRKRNRRQTSNLDINTEREKEDAVKRACTSASIAAVEDGSGSIEGKGLVKGDVRGLAETSESRVAGEEVAFVLQESTIQGNTLPTPLDDQISIQRPQIVRINTDIVHIPRTPLSDIIPSPMCMGIDSVGNDILEDQTMVMSPTHTSSALVSPVDSNMDTVGQDGLQTFPIRPTPIRSKSNKLVKRRPSTSEIPPLPTNIPLGSTLFEQKPTYTHTDSKVVPPRARTRSTESQAEFGQMIDSSVWRYGRKRTDSGSTSTLKQKADVGSKEDKPSKRAPPSAWPGSKFEAEPRPSMISRSSSFIQRRLSLTERRLMPSLNVAWGKDVNKPMTSPVKARMSGVDEFEKRSSDVTEFEDRGRGGAMTSALEARKDKGRRELVQTPGETVYGIGWQPEDAIKPYIVLRPLCDAELGEDGTAIDRPEVAESTIGDNFASFPPSVAPSSPSTPRSPSTDSLDWHTSGSQTTHATTLYSSASSSSCHMLSTSPQSYSMLATYSNSSSDAGPVRHYSMPSTPAILTPSSSTVSMSELLYRKSTSAKRPRLQRTLAMSQIISDDNIKVFTPAPPSRSPGEQAIEDLLSLDSERRRRQMLMEIEDDAMFARVLGELMKANKQAATAEMATDYMMIVPPCMSPRTEETRYKKMIRAFFLVRELLAGERSYRKQLVKGIEMLMEDVIRDQSFAMGLDGSPAKLTKEHRRSSTVFSDTAAIPGLAIAARSAPGTMRRSQAKDRPQSFYVTRSSSETPETRTRTFSEINGDPTQSDRQRHCQTLLKHLRELCTISRRLAHYLEFDPSPVKAAATFIQHYDELLRVYSDWAAVVGDIIASGIGNTIPAKAALRRKDTMRTRRRSLRYGDEDVRKPTAELLLADIIIKPTGRSGQYVLLFQEIMDCVTEGSSEDHDIQKALTAAKKLAAECNRRQDKDMRLSQMLA